MRSDKHPLRRHACPRVGCLRTGDSKQRCIRGAVTANGATVGVLASSDPQLPYWWSANGVSELLTPVGGVVPVLGAGVSVDAGLPDASQLALWLSNNAPISEPPPDGTDLLSVIDAIDLTQLPAAELQELVANHIESFPLQPTPILDELVHLPSRFIVTLNYDDLVGKAAENQGLKVCRLSAADPGDLREAHRRLLAKAGWGAPELTVLHLHGQAQTANTLVLDAASYEELGRLRDIDEIVFMLTHYRTLAFVGTTLNEVYLLGKLQAQINAAFHVVLCHQNQLQELTTGRAALSSRQHLRVVGYPDHADLIALPRWLNAPQPPRGTRAPTETLEPDLAPEAADYVASEFDDRALVATPVSEDDIRDGQRTIVVGVAGTGKTHLLSYLAANSPTQRPAVRIRLADVPFRPGSPEQILAVWARHARSAPKHLTVDVSASALREDRVHFLLDGLDEVANELQATAATLIDQIAERFPQHAFTVTSRPLPALAVLGYGAPPESTPWRFVDLVPGAAWQERYLATRGLTLSELEATMPALKDMRELLHIPFFLTRTVELSENGQLEGLRDVGELLERLVDFALTREEGLLPMVGLPEARAWLRRVALAAAIAGRRTFRFDELREVPVAKELAGDLDALVQQLQLRLLLSEEDGQLRFAHRLLADELAAEALADMQPSEPLLDVLVPIVDAQLAGVREDVLIAVSLVCLRSTAWREAVARRDPLAAARSTPSGSEATERAAAVSLLWETYRDWGIWAWDRSTANLVEDTAVIARLLRRNPGGEQVAELRRLLQTADEIQQGNAVRVLQLVAPEGLIEDLRRVMRDPTRNGVVIRQATIAAADLHMTELIDDIVFAMLQSTDSAIHQDSSIALQRLTPDDRLLDVALRLVPCRDGNHFAAFVIERMRAAERIELAKAIAIAKVDVLERERADLTVAADQVAPNAAVIQAAACAAALWHNYSDEVKALLDHDPQATALGLLEARDHGAEWWDITRLAAHADLDMLRAAATDDRVIQAAERERELRAMSPAQRDELQRAVEASLARDREAADAEAPLPTRLSELLCQPPAQSDATLQAHALEFEGQVPALSDDDLRELRARLATWWPNEPLRSLITVEGEQYRVPPPVRAWLFLAPAAGMAVNDEQWAQLATSPLIHYRHCEWLRPQATELRMRRAVAFLVDTTAKAWLRLLDCCSAPPPGFVVDACTASVTSEVDRPEHTTVLMQQLVSEGATPGARAWAERDEVATKALRPVLAAEGDVDAQRMLVRELVDDVRAERWKPRDELAWMSTLRSPEFLEPLFEILETVYPSRADRPTSGWGVSDVLTPTMEAITTIGTRDAVRRYDALLSRGDELRWLRRHRDRIAAEVLTDRGAAASAGAAEIASVPLWLPVD
ncbi:MAG: hypothetical protein QOI73_2662 [Solirubrobacteraceae bacterium]|nr:hypothetical protein [Solirubrobacteraceae bacterium]